jgi:hypothetical protein
MSHPSEFAPHPESLDRLCTSIRGKLQFMDYLVRAAVADLDRFHAETDSGTRIFLRQLVEMHASNLALECGNMRLLGDLCRALESALAAPPDSSRPAPDLPAGSSPPHAQVHQPVNGGAA